MAYTEPLDALLDFAAKAAIEAGLITLQYYQTSLAVDRKRDNTVVTAADRQAEEKLRALILSEFPNHSILGEEFGEHRGAAPYRWILDPIDGTLSFIQGVPLYGVLVGLEADGEAVLGVAHFPALGETVCAAKGVGCFWNGVRARVSPVNQLSDALLLTTDVSSMYQYGRGPAYERLQAATRLHRGWGDCYGYALVATGRAEIMLDPVLSIWDAAALLPVLQEAGGTFTDWNGQATIHGGNGIATNGVLLGPVMEIVRSA
jgi:histidinol phosphatase-like enzyme (inositol monophosphatase family)